MLRKERQQYPTQPGTQASHATGVASSTTQPKFNSSREPSGALLDYDHLAAEVLQCRRLAIVGNQGAGKSTLAEQLANILAVEFVDVAWGPDNATALRERLTRQNGWVIDGAFPVIDHVERVIFLDFPLSLCLWRATTRAFKNLCLWSFASPKLLLQIPPKLSKLLLVLTDICKASSRPCPATASSWRPTAETITFTSPKQVDLLLEALYARKRDASWQRRTLGG